MRSTWRCGLLVALAVIVFAAPIGGAAMVPDPTWIGGLYDGGDADEILLLVWDGAPGVAPMPPVLLEPRAVALEPLSRVAPVAPVIGSDAASRAPPLR